MSQMIEVKTAELSGPSLRWAVAQAEGLEVTIHPPAYGNGHRLAVNGKTEAYRPDTDWGQGGPLLDRHCKSFGCVQDGRDGTWRAFGYGKGEAFDPNRTMRLASGPSILVAACRAIVAAKLGDTVAVPAELLP